MNEPAHVHLDAVGGIAGDMFVAAMLDAFPYLEERVFADLARVLPAEAGRPELAEGRSGAVRVKRFGLVSHDKSGRHSAHDHHHDHHHGRYRELAALIENASLSNGTSAEACAILGHIARVEAHIHQIAIDEVHFHEIAGWDSLMDVVAAGSIIAALPGVSWSVSDLPRGGGLVNTEHGRLPVPAPATVALLEGFTWRDDGISGERVTPTGAAILRHIITLPSRKAAGRLVASGTGAGTRELPAMPNILRVLAFVSNLTAGSSDSVVVLSFDIDDMTGEEIGTAADKLRALEGVLDLAIGTLAGKKGRPLSAFRLLVAPAHLDAVKAKCLSETSTIGLRWHVEDRDVLERETDIAHHDAGALRVKRVRRPDGTVTGKVESDDLAPLETYAARSRAKKRIEERTDS